MAEVRTRDEAIALVDRAVGQWERSLTDILNHANAVVRSAQTEAERVVRRCADKVAAIEVMLAAAAPEQRRALQAELVRARAAHDQARRALVRIGDVAAGVGQLRRAHGTNDLERVRAAQSQLAGMAAAIEGYRRVVVGGGGGGGGGGGSAIGAAGPGRPFSVSDHGLSELQVDAADLADTPIQGEFGRGGASRADYRWAVQTWSDTVAPGVAKGMTRDDFTARDERNGAPPLRRTADVYDMFLGTDRIRVDRRPDGTLNIVNGRHRLQVARELGITSLPGQVS